MIKTFKHVSVRVWPERVLSQEQESDLLIQWEATLEELAVEYRGPVLRMELIADQDLDLSFTDIALLICAAQLLPNVVMVDVQASGPRPDQDLSLRVHLDHRPTELLCELYRRRVLDAEQMVLSLQRLNVADMDLVPSPSEPEPVT